MKTNRRIFILAFFVLTLAASWKLLLQHWGAFPFNADEAIVALMARHILQGERPLFFYGQAYMGSLDAYLVAAGFALLGQHVWVIRAIQMILYTGTLATTVILGALVLRSTQSGIYAAALLAIPAVNMTLYTTVSLGGYGEALLIGNLVLICATCLVNRLTQTQREVYPQKQAALWAGLWGLFSGLGLWANGLTLIYVIPSAVVIWWNLIHNFPGARIVALGTALPACIGLGAGSFPWWLFALQNEPANLVRELLGSAVSVEQGSLLARSGAHLVNLALLGFPAMLGLRPPWEVRWLALPLLPIGLAFWLATGIFALRRCATLPRADAGWMLPGTAAALLAGFLFTSFGVDPSGRYFIPLYLILALAAGKMLVDKVHALPLRIGLALVVILFNTWGTVQSMLTSRTGITTQFDQSTVVDHSVDAELIRFLHAQDEKFGYTTYWISYPLAFLSQEELIYVPRLPYHQDFRYTPRDDRYGPYRDIVTAAPRAAYITAQQPELEDYLVRAFEGRHITWDEAQIGDYHVYYRLSEKVTPEEIGLGVVSTGIKP
ncbi:MAG: hypothetical protein GYA17_22235 [Chloroflexi bacterium]|nr:hypothetical protein [Chloroflexota bacterium]